MGLGSHVLSELGGVSVSSVLNSSVSHNTGVNGARDAVGLLDVNLGHLEVSLSVSVILLDISLGGGIDHVSLLEALNGLVLGDDSTAVSASHSISMTLVLLVSSVVSSLRWHFIN